MNTSKKKLTLSIDENVIEKARQVAQKRNIPMSRAVESFLSFFADPTVYCFNCGEAVLSSTSELCPKCGWLLCPNCHSCRCKLSDESAVAIFHMRRVYEDLLSGRIK